MPAVARIMARYDRPKLEAFIAVAIDLLDTLDGDDDVELNGDEHDDPGDLTDTAWPQWETRGCHKLAALHDSEMPPPRSIGQAYDEDSEDDDPDTGVEDGPEGFDPESDMCLAGDDRVTSGVVITALGYFTDLGPGDELDAEFKHHAPTDWDKAGTLWGA